VLRLAASLQGLSGESVAIILAVGLVLGTFPVYGCPTAFCFLAALALRVNAPALQLVNQLVSPMQVGLLIPFARTGERVFGSPLTASGSIVSRFSGFTLHAIAGWFCLAIPMGILTYLTLSFALRRELRLHRQNVSVG
jgi:uncharacterized protein (DUF2062 family)